MGSNRARQWYWEKDALAAALTEHGSINRVAHATGVSRNTLQTWARRHELRSGHRCTPGGADAQPSAPVREAEPAELTAMRRTIDRKDAELKSLRVEVRHLAKRENLLDDIRDLLAPVVAGCVLPKPRVVRPAKSQRKPVTLVLHLSDIHWGEIVRPDVVGGLNAYSPGIAARRLQRAVDATLAWIANYGDLAGVEELVVAVNGDSASGMHALHADSADEYARIARQVLDVALVLSQVVWELASAVPRVRIIGTQGNHTRSTRRMPTGPARTETSWETLLHEFVSALLIQAPNVSTRIARSYRITTRIGPSTWAWMHGDAMKGGGGNLGIPAYGLKRAHDATREQSLVLAQMQESDGLDGVVRHTRVGHFHLYTKWQMGDGDIAITPSGKGVDNFVTDVLAKYSRAAYLLEAVHPDFDVIGDHLLDVQSVMDESAPCRYSWGALTDDATASDRMGAWIGERREVQR